MHVLWNRTQRKSLFKRVIFISYSVSKTLLSKQRVKKVAGFGEAVSLVVNTKIDLKGDSLEWSDQPLDSQNLFKLKTRNISCLHLKTLL